MNISRTLRLLGLPLLAVAASANAQQPAVTLKPGDPAPALKIGKWIQGQPVTDLGHGKVNVVEFWATWCGPCKESIPHLTELSKRYKGKVTFTGVDAFENQGPWDPKTYAKVAAFVKSMGPKMAYNVAADGPTGAMGKTWMDAAGQNGIPTAFVIDQQGRVAWIGHPMDHLDGVLDKVLAHKFDIAAESKRQAEARAKEEAQEKAMQDALAPAFEALQAGKNQEAVAALDKAAVDHPEMAPQIANLKYGLLLRTDEPAAMAYAKTLATDGPFKNDPVMLNQIAWSIVGDDSKLKKPDYAVGLSVAKRAVELQPNEPDVLDTLAYAYYRSGDSAKAIATEQQALAAARKAGKSAEEVKPLTDHLATFQVKKV